MTMSSSIVNQAKCNNSLQLIGSTPLVKLNNMARSNGANIYAKLECFNPGGSVKDRIAMAMVEDAESRGILKPGLQLLRRPVAIQE